MRESVRAGRSWGCAAAARITSQKAPECSAGDEGKETPIVESGRLGVRE